MMKDTVQDLLDQIAIERRIEFLGEGFRSLDIMRLGQTFPAKGGVGAVASIIMGGATKLL